jgi:hypothetical protein
MKLPQYDNRKPNTPLYDPNFGKDPLTNEKSALSGLLAIVGIPVCLGLVGWSVFVFLRMIFGH